MRIDWRPRAEQDLAEIVAYTVENYSSIAEKIVHTILEEIQSLGTHPGLGRPGRLNGTRELIVSTTPFIVAYRHDEKHLEILRILHGAQKWPASL